MTLISCHLFGYQAVQALIASWRHGDVDLLEDGRGGIQRETDIRFRDPTYLDQSWSRAVFHLFDGALENHAHFPWRHHDMPRPYRADRIVQPVPPQPRKTEFCKIAVGFWYPAIDVHAAECADRHTIRR